MTIQPISDGSLALYLSPAELAERGLRPGELSEGLALKLGREALRQAGLSPGEPLELEAYPDKSGLLMFIHIRPARPSVWSFADWEDLLAGVAALGEGISDGAVYWWRDRFWLALSGEEQAGRLWEFAGREEGDPYILARLEEYGSPLLTAGAPAALRRCFKL